MSGEEIQEIEGLLDRFKEDIQGEFRHQLGIQREDFQKHVAVIGEGFQMLSEKIDRVETRLDKRMDCLEHKLAAVAAETNGNTIAIRDLTAETNGNTIAIRDLTAETRGNTIAIRDLTHKVDAVAADLSAHRADTEAHRPVYRVKE
jgi:hypothetical protein